MQSGGDFLSDHFPAFEACAGDGPDIERYLDLERLPSAFSDAGTEWPDQNTAGCGQQFCGVLCETMGFDLVGSAACHDTHHYPVLVCAEADHTGNGGRSNQIEGDFENYIVC